MEKIRIDAGCLNGLNRKQDELYETIKAKILELWPDTEVESKELGRCYWNTTYKNDAVELSFTVDSSD